MTSTTRRAAPATRRCAARTRGSRRYVHAALGDARTVLNVGAGAGLLRAGRPLRGRGRAVGGDARAAPPAPRRDRRRRAAAVRRRQLRRGDGDGHDPPVAATSSAGLRELRRVARGPVVILTFDGPAMRDFWLDDYVPEVFASESARDPGLDRVAAVLGGEVTRRRGADPARLRRRLRRGLLRAARGAAGPRRAARAVGVGVRRARGARAWARAPARRAGVRRVGRAPRPPAHAARVRRRAAAAGLSKPPVAARHL